MKTQCISYPSRRKELITALFLPKIRHSYFCACATCGQHFGFIVYCSQTLYSHCARLYNNSSRDGDHNPRVLCQILLLPVKIYVVFSFIPICLYHENTLTDSECADEEDIAFSNE